MEEDARELPEEVEVKTEKFGKGWMLWGGVTSRGLVPRDGPVFVEDFLYKSRKEKHTMDAEEYERLLEEKARPALKERRSHS